MKRAVSLSTALLIIGSVANAEEVDFRRYSNRDIHRFLTLERIAGMVIGTCMTAQAAKIREDIAKEMVAGVLDGAALTGEKLGGSKKSAIQFVRSTVFSADVWAEKCREYWPAEYR